MSINVTTRAAEDSSPDDSRKLQAGTGRLWFEVAASAGAWFGIGLSDMIITWRACVHEEQFGNASAHPGARVLYFLFTFVLIGVALLAGTISYRSWQKVAGMARLLRAEGQERREFMALAGLFISFTLGAGMIWLCLPLFILEMCLRAR